LQLSVQRKAGQHGWFGRVSSKQETRTALAQGVHNRQIKIIDALCDLRMCMPLRHTSPISLDQAGRNEADFPLEFGIVRNVLNQHYRRAIPDVGSPHRFHQRSQLAHVRSLDELPSRSIRC
jgi:hypothetical protein